MLNKKKDCISSDKSINRFGTVATLIGVMTVAPLFSGCSKGVQAEDPMKTKMEKVSKAIDWYNGRINKLKTNQSSPPEQDSQNTAETMITQQLASELGEALSNPTVSTTTAKTTLQ